MKVIIVTIGILPLILGILSLVDPAWIMDNLRTLIAGFVAILGTIAFLLARTDRRRTLVLILCYILLGLAAILLLELLPNP